MMVRTFNIGLCVFLLLTSIVNAIEVPIECRVINNGPYCGWCSLETLGRYHGIQRLNGLATEKQAIHKFTGNLHICYDKDISAELTTRHVRFAMRDQWSMETDLLEKYATTHGVALGLKQGNPWCGGAHMIVITKFDKENNKAEFYDPSKYLNGGKPIIWKCGADWLLQWWYGSTVVIFPDNEVEAE